METLRVGLCDFWESFDFEKTLICDILEKHFKIEYDNMHPHILFYSVYMNNHRKYKDCIKVRLSGECDKYLDDADFYIGLNKSAVSDMYLWMPWYFYGGSHYVNQCCPIESLLNRKKGIGEGVCFLASNSRSKERIRMFEYLSRYFAIDSAGRTLNNQGKILPKDVTEHRNFYASHKFSLSFENEKWGGYLTEKILIPLANGCIPIYRGDPFVEEVVNKDCFINANNMTDEQIVEAIRQIDNDDTIRQWMCRQPVLLKTYEEYQSEVELFVNKIIDFIYQKYGNPKTN